MYDAIIYIYIYKYKCKLQHRNLSRGLNESVYMHSHIEVFFQYFHFMPSGNTNMMRTLSHIIQEVIERDSANRSRTENKAKYLLCCMGEM